MCPSVWNVGKFCIEASCYDKFFSIFFLFRIFFFKFFVGTDLWQQNQASYWLPLKSGNASKVFFLFLFNFRVIQNCHFCHFLLKSINCILLQFCLVIGNKLLASKKLLEAVTEKIKMKRREL